MGFKLLLSSFYCKLIVLADLCKYKIAKTIFFSTLRDNVYTLLMTVCWMGCAVKFLDQGHDIYLYKIIVLLQCYFPFG